MTDVKSILAQMTLEEKAGLSSGKDFWHLKGVERLGVPVIMVTDGPHGLRKQDESVPELALEKSVPATCFPTASALASTWDRDLVYQVGVALGEECRQEKVGVILGPGANIKRSPLCGRNFEYFSEDPYLSGEIAKSHINGVQSQGIGTSLKHFAVNNQEFRRMTIDAVVDERTLREIYLAGYEIAVKDAQPWTVMCSYNRINGTYACENQYLMRDILKEEWGHTGLVVTDWGAMNRRVDSLVAGTELEMPGVQNSNDELLVAAVRNGSIKEEVLDRAVELILTMIYKANETLALEFRYDPDAHHALARKTASEAAVLLKNEGGLLPLGKKSKVAVIGAFAKTPRYQGAGSSLMNPTRLDTLYEEMAKLVGEEQLSYAPGYPLRVSLQDEAVDEELIQEAVLVVKTADVVVISTGLPDIFEVEGLDRQHMRLPRSYTALIEAIAAAHPNVAVVLSNGSPVEMPWAGKVKAILTGHLGGQAGGGGVADVLYGLANPCGKLAETYPLHLEDTPCYPNFPGGPRTVEYRESVYVGYRYYDSVLQPVLYPFGHGLSYTYFEYSDLQLSHVQNEGGDGVLVMFKVKNSGSLEGKEVVQVYVRDVESTVFRPYKELKGFDKVALLPGEEQAVTIELDRRAFAYYEPVVKDWQVESGAFEILVGASSQDIRLRAMVDLNSQPVVSLSPERKAKLAEYYHFPKGKPVSQAAFEALLGHPVPVNEQVKGAPYDLNTPIEDLRGSFIGRQLAGTMRTQVAKMMQGQEDTPTAALMFTMTREAPLRTMMMFGGMSRPTLEGLLLLVNGKYLGGLIKLARARKKK